MESYPLQPIIVQAMMKLDDDLTKYDLHEIIDKPQLMEHFLKSFSFDNKNECLWCLDIVEYVDLALEYEYITEEQREDFLMEYLLGVSL